MLWCSPKHSDCGPAVIAIGTLHSFRFSSARRLTSPQNANTVYCSVSLFSQVGLEVSKHTSVNQAMLIWTSWNYVACYPLRRLNSTHDVQPLRNTVHLCRWCSLGNLKICLRGHGGSNISSGDPTPHEVCEN